MTKFGALSIQREQPTVCRPVARRMRGASLFSIAAATLLQPAYAQTAVCPQPGASAASPAGGGTSAHQRLRDRDPLVREMARADILEDQGRAEEAAPIYRRLAEARPDRRQTARRAHLRLAQLASSARDFGTAESHVRTAMAPGASADVAERGRRLLATIAYRRGVADAEAALDRVDALVAAGSNAEAVQATQALLLRQCPYPPDYPARVKTRLARIYRAQGEFAQARALAVDAQASATTPTISQGAAQLIAEIDAAALAAELRAAIGQANDRMAAGDNAGAVAILEPVIARPGIPPEINTTARLRLARAYAQTGRFDDATAVIEPLVAGGELDAEGHATAARIHLSRADAMRERGSLAEADAGYRRVLAWTPPVDPEARDAARLGLARTLAGSGDRRGALEQARLVRSEPATPDSRERALSLMADIQGDIPLNRLVGHVETGLAYDSNVPTLVSAMEDDGDDVGFPVSQRFSDTSVTVAGQVQYHHQMGASDSYLALSVAGFRSFQFDLEGLDRSRIDLRAGPAFAVGGDGLTWVMVGGTVVAEWRGSRFRSSEPGVYAGVRSYLGNNLTVTALYTLGRHDDYRDDRDGLDHSLSAQLRYDPGTQDVVRFDLRATREETDGLRFRNWRLRGIAGWTHRWRPEGRAVPFVDLGASVERAIYDGVSPSGIARRDLRLRFDAEAGVELDRRLRASLHYAFYDLNSTLPERDRLSGHQVGLLLRYSWR